MADQEARSVLGWGAGPLILGTWTSSDIPGHRHATAETGEGEDDKLTESEFSLATFVGRVQAHAASAATDDDAPPFLPAPARHQHHATYMADLARREERPARRWEHMISRTPTSIIVSLLFSFPEGRSGRTLLSNGTNGLGRMTEALCLMPGRTAEEEQAQVLLAHFLQDRELIGMLDKKRRRLHPDAPAAVVSRRHHLAYWKQTWQVKLESFRDGFDWFMGVGDLRGYC
ncbi:hypothetical protein B0A55_04978 [Friedmanniomyces simplex]|uniref:Uncharacterized protein n=1 Tax=Friedmanniomyces simplex TaxID=329884 RepID=A0A4U0X583_9PEZI|nr:hypothetical protein B0A55_04978 [Friedmanniomyces simplex]